MKDGAVGAIGDMCFNPIKMSQKWLFWSSSTALDIFFLALQMDSNYILNGEKM